MRNLFELLQAVVVAAGLLVSLLFDLAVTFGRYLLGQHDYRHAWQRRWGFACFCTVAALGSTTLAALLAH